MKKIQQKSKRILAVILVVLIMLPGAAVFASAEQEETVVPSVEVFANGWDGTASVYAEITGLDGVGGPRAYDWSFYILSDEPDKLVDVKYDSYNGTSIEAYSLAYGRYRVVFTLFYGQGFSQTLTGAAEFTVSKWYPESERDIAALYDALYENFNMNDLNKFDYAIESWEAFESIWYSAMRTLNRAIYGHRTPSQDSIDQAAAGLEAAFNALELRTNSNLNIASLLETLYEECCLYYLSWYDYTSTTWLAFETAWYAAEDVLNEVWGGNESLTQEDIDAAEAALRTAFDGLVYGDFYDLDIGELYYALYYSCYIYNFDSYAYTQDSWERFHNAWYGAYYILDDIWYYEDWEDEEDYYFPIYSQEDIDEAVEKLCTACDGLKERGGLYNIGFFRVLIRMWEGREDVLWWFLEPFYFIIEWITTPFHSLLDILGY